ncbi:MAG: helix-turn-helix domain-containing protein, partial [Inhella sp.]
PPPTLSPQALERLRAYSFPGNVRELENLLHRGLALSGASRLEVEDLDLPDGCVDDSGFGALAPSSMAPLPAAELDALPSDLTAYLDAVERSVLERALALCRNNRTAAGQRLGLSLRQMRYRMARLGIQLDEAD